MPFATTDNLPGSQFDVGGHVELRVRLAVKDVFAVGIDDAHPGDDWSHSENHRRKQLPASAPLKCVLEIE
jgi:hypothetical protein